LKNNARAAELGYSEFGRRVRRRRGFRRASGRTNSLLTQSRNCCRSKPAAAKGKKKSKSPAKLNKQEEREDLPKGTVDDRKQAEMLDESSEKLEEREGGNLEIILLLESGIKF